MLEVPKLVTPEMTRIIDRAAEYVFDSALPEKIGRPLLEDVLISHTDRRRFYHIVRHIGDFVGFLVENADELEDPQATILAGFGHDEFLNPRLHNGVNEEVSAIINGARWEPHLGPEKAGRIQSHIRASYKHVWNGIDMDEAYFLDGDLKILGAPEDEFDLYDENIEREFYYVPPEIYGPAREGVLLGFYNTPRLFITDVAHDKYEGPAKANIARKLELAVGLPDTQA